MLRLRDPKPGRQLPDEVQQALINTRIPAINALKKTYETRFFFLSVLFGLIGMFCAFGWFVSDKRFAENVRVAYVKLSPAGPTEVEYSDNDKPVDFFETTVNSKLTEWVVKRYSKRKETITDDYAFAYLFLSPQLKTDFLANFDAAKVSSEFEKCNQCEQVNIKVRNIKQLEAGNQPGSERHQQYTNLIYVVSQHRSADGRLMQCHNQLLTVLWRIRDKSETVKHKDELPYNPLGQEIIRADYSDDPTPITLDECKKMK